MKRRMFGYCGVTSTSSRAPGCARDDLLGGAAQQRGVRGELVVVEVAHDRADLGAARRRRSTLVGVDEALAARRCARA